MWDGVYVRTKVGAQGRGKVWREGKDVREWRAGAGSVGVKSLWKVVTDEGNGSGSGVEGKVKRTRGRRGQRGGGG